ncbi:ISL3 family transposase [Streptomyces sp. NPDC002666]
MIDEHGVHHCGGAGWDGLLGFEELDFEVGDAFVGEAEVGAGAFDPARASRLTRPQITAALKRAGPLIDDYRLYLHHRWMEGCTNASALTREIQRLGYRGDVNTVRRHLKPYRNGAIPVTAPLPHLTVRRVTDWIMRRPEHLTGVERKGLDKLCERNPALATTVAYARRLALMIRDHRSEHLALDVWMADFRLDGQRELRTLANGMRRDDAAVQAALTTTYTSGAVEGNVTRIKLLKRQMYGRANFDLLRRRILLSP